ncbi:TetR/AcrR family transcriptional regulator [Gimibacter soli]|uniref:TetR/AcrR family transcriptional regulator n=1 Tax=Gimibacter soli TaxID=3024400 RepID=A0AAE9XNM2_9PROT|nr:TetR/AcrR family transcriptional regulator [Gimibacter soli]WCL53471.1 TetR/AcrR family transcriptional regulator [Gimibacter soli]
MPYSASHKMKTRGRIVEAARVLFNKNGFEKVTIDQIMEASGLTRGGFYNHFQSKEALYSEAVDSFLMGRGAEWRKDAQVDSENPSIEAVRRMVLGYLSVEHLADVEGQCPMIALPSDVARANPSVQAAYQRLLEAMVRLFQQGMSERQSKAREKALSLAALCVGGMVLARTIPDKNFAEEIRTAAQEMVEELIGAL